MELAIKPSNNITPTSSVDIRRVSGFLLLSTYGVFLCSYFIFLDYSDPYRFFARVLFVLGLFVFYRSMQCIWKHPLFIAVTGYMAYLLLSGLWSTPLDWYRLGQKTTICLYILGFFATTNYLVNWNAQWFERMLRVCTLFAAVAAIVSIVIFYRENPFPATRLEGIGSLTNINEFANVYGVFAILGMFFAMRSKAYSLKLVFLLAVTAFVCVTWFGQSRTAFTSLSIALLALIGLTLHKKKLLYAAVLVSLVAFLLLLFPDVLEQAYQRGQGLRPQIWSQVWNEAIESPILGHGFVTQLSIPVDGTIIETSHNAHLQVFWQAGIIGLLAFLVVLGIAFRHAWSRGSESDDYRVFCMLLYCACAMMTGVDSVIARPRDQWMLFWFPLALLLSCWTQANASQFGRFRTGSAPGGILDS